MGRCSSETNTLRYYIHLKTDSLRGNAIMEREINSIKIEIVPFIINLCWIVSLDMDEFKSKNGA